MPSLTVMVTSTRLRSRRDTVGVISTLYLPRLLYWRVSSWVTRSRARRSKVSPSDRPASFRPLSRSSDLMSLLPVSVSLLIAGRSVTVTTRMCPGGRRCTSSKKPVLYSARIASPAREASIDVAALDRQVGEHRTGGDALQAVDADVADGERPDRRARPSGRRADSANGSTVCASTGRAVGLSAATRARASRRRLGVRVIITSGRGSWWPGTGRRVEAKCAGSVAGISAPGCSRCRCRTPGPSGRRSMPGRRIARLPSRAR